MLKRMEYVEQRDGGNYVAGTRISLDSVVYAHLRGETPEGIVYSFPALTLERVNGGIDYCLTHRSEIDAYLEQARHDYERLRQEGRAKNPALHEKLEAAKREMLSRRGQSGRELLTFSHS